MKILLANTKFVRSTLERRRNILSRSSRAGNPAYAIQARIRKSIETPRNSFFTLKLGDWSNLRVLGLWGVVSLGIWSSGWINPWAGTADGAYQVAQLASGYEIIVAEGVASSRG